MKYILQGELETLNNGNKSTVIMQLVCKDKSTAEQLMEDRYHQYKKMQVIKYKDLYPEK